MSSESGRPVCFRAVVSYSWLTVVEILVRMPQYVACGVAWRGVAWRWADLRRATGYEQLPARLSRTC